MGKTKTSNKLEEFWNSCETVAINNHASLIQVDVSKQYEEMMSDTDIVSKIFFKALEEGNHQEATEIINDYVAVKKRLLNREKQASNSSHHRVSAAQGNPTLKTLATILHSVAQEKPALDLNPKKSRKRQKALAAVSLYTSDVLPPKKL